MGDVHIHNYATPAAEPVALSGVVKIAKVDAPRGLVFGWGNVSVRKDGTQVEDSQSDLIDPDDLEDAAYAFALSFRDTGEMHRGESKGRMVESVAFTPEKLEKMGLPIGALPTAWWLGFQLDDPETIAKVQRGELTMFSIQGKAVREPV